MKFFLTLAIFFILSFIQVLGQAVLKVAIAGLNHDHVNGILNLHKEGKVDIVGIAEPDQALAKKIRDRAHFSESLFYSDLKTLLGEVKPQAVLAYNATDDHVSVAEICMPLKVPVMVEKPLAVNMKQARRIQQLSEENNTPFLTNYETTWYKSMHKLKELLAEQSLGKLKKVMVKDGHEGPIEIGCSDDFLAWLTDPIKNGGGALMDFGCYGANLITWFKNGEKPTAVEAVTRRLKPEKYPKVEDDATIIVTYADGTTGVIQASWDWPYGIKDLAIFGEEKMLYAPNGNALMEFSSPTKSVEIPLSNSYYENHLDYLSDFLSGKIKPGNDLSSLSNNMIVMEILEAAKESAKTGRRVTLKN